MVDDFHGEASQFNPEVKLRNISHDSQTKTSNLAKKNSLKSERNISDEGSDFDF